MLTGKLNIKNLKVIPWDPEKKRLSVGACNALIRLDWSWAYHHKKVHIDVNDAYRTFARQTELYNHRGDKGWPRFAAKPGTSVHGTGEATDLGGLGGFHGAGYKWMTKYGNLFGWYHPIAYREDGPTPEYWHWEHDDTLDQMKAGWYHVTAASTTARKSPRRETRRGPHVKRGYKIYAVRQYISLEGEVWLKTRFGNYYLKERTAEGKV